VFCADMKRPTEASERTGANVVRGMTEQLLVASVDTALMAQNVTIAAESEGLGICYIGGIRNNPQAVSDLLRLPEHVYPVFGMCLGYPAVDPEVKPRLPVEAILKEDYYTDDSELVAAFDEAMQAYYGQRTGGNKETNWSRNLTPLFDSKLRAHMREFLTKRGFEMK
jgi:nitroreductase